MGKETESLEWNVETIGLQIKYGTANNNYKRVNLVRIWFQLTIQPAVIC